MAAKASFLTRQDKFITEVLDMPFNIACSEYVSVLKDDSGITDWREDVLHLEKQHQRDQIGNFDSLDMKQKKKDNNKLETKLKTIRVEEAKKVVTGPLIDQIEVVDDEDNEDEVENNDQGDKDFEVRKRCRKRRKVDVMGPITATADRLGLSVRQRVTRAASVANNLGV